MSAEISSIHRPSTMLPPRAFLIALLAELPLIASNWPLQPGAWELAAGGVFIVAGVVLNVWAERLFRRNATGVCPFSPASVLVRRGPYRLSRNPMYLGLVAMTLGTSLATGMLSNIWISVAFAIWLHYAYILPEETFLHARFGAEYEHYAKATPRWLGLIEIGETPKSASSAR